MWAKNLSLLEGTMVDPVTVNVRTDKLFFLLTPNADELRTASQISGMNSWTWFL